MSSNSINLSWLTRPVESSETDTTTTTTKITGDNDTDQKINNYFNKRKKTDKASNPTDTLAEVYAKYDKNHNGKLDRSEWQAAGMTKKEAQAFNKAIKACGGDEGKIKSYALDDGSGTMYTDKNGKKLFSIQSQNGNTVTTLYDDNNQPKTVTTENQNYTKTEEFGTDGKPKKTTIKYTDAYSAAHNGVKTTEVETGGYITQTTEFNYEEKKTKVIEQMNEDASSVQTTEFGENGSITTTYSGTYIDDKIIKKEVSNDSTTYTYTDGTTKKEELSEDGKTKTVTITDAEGKVSSTETYTFQDGTWVKQEPEPEEKPEEETEQNAALEALKDGFDKGNTISVTIQGGQTKLSSGDYQGTINLARGETFEEGKMPQTLFMTLPQGSTGKMKLTYDESTGLYTTTRGDRQFRITADNGKITMEAVTDNQGVQKKLNRNIDEYKTKIDLSKSYTAKSRSVNATLGCDNNSSWKNANLDDSTKSKVQQYFDLSSVCLADAANMDKNDLKMYKSSDRSMTAKLPDGRWIRAFYDNKGELKSIRVSFNSADDYNVNKNKEDYGETYFIQSDAFAFLAHNQGENNYCISGDAYSFDNIKAVALKIFPETWSEN